MRKEQEFKAIVTAVLLSRQQLSTNTHQLKQEVGNAQKAADLVIETIMGADKDRVEDWEEDRRAYERLEGEFRARGIELEGVKAQLKKAQEQLSDGETAVAAARAVIAERAEDVRETDPTGRPPKAKVTR